MMTYWLEVSAIFLGVLGIIQGANRLWIKRLVARQHSPQPFVSVLVPARNESMNIERCVTSLLAQTYPHYEVIVYDDRSQDDTAQKVFAIKDPRLWLIQGGDLPPGWPGKHHACHQLAKGAQGTYWLFVDADTTHHPQMLDDAMARMCADHLDLMSAFVEQKTLTLGEKVTVPFPYWAVFTVLPMFVGRWFKWPAFTAANGQFMLFKASSYEHIGGHEAVKGTPVDDMALARLIVRHKYRWRMVDATAVSSCRMYHTFSESFHGFKKNYFGMVDYRILPALFVWVWMLYVQWYAPFILILDRFKPILTPYPRVLAWTSVLIMAGLWAHFAIRMKQSFWIWLLYPVIMTLSPIIGMVSMVATLRNRQTWKGRDLDKPKIRWL